MLDYFKDGFRHGAEFAGFMLGFLVFVIAGTSLAALCVYVFGKIVGAF